MHFIKSNFYQNIQVLFNNHHKIFNWIKDEYCSVAKEYSFEKEN